MTPRELPKYEVLFSPFVLFFLFDFDLVGRVRAFLAGRAHPIDSKLRWVQCPLVPCILSVGQQPTTSIYSQNTSPTGLTEFSLSGGNHFFSIHHASTG